MRPPSQDQGCRHTASFDPVCDIPSAGTDKLASSTRPDGSSIFSWSKADTTGAEAIITGVLEGAGSRCRGGLGFVTVLYSFLSLPVCMPTYTKRLEAKRSGAVAFKTRLGARRVATLYSTAIFDCSDGFYLVSTGRDTDTTDVIVARDGIPWSEDTRDNHIAL